jgi:hypothetical protein
MSEYDLEPDVPHIDDTTPRRKLHERCEQVAVPNFDWMSQPIVAMVDGLVHVESHTHEGGEHAGEEHPHRRWHLHLHRHKDGEAHS